MATTKYKPKEPYVKDVGMLDSQLVPYPCQFCDNEGTCAHLADCRRYETWFTFKWHEIQYMFTGDKSSMSLLELKERSKRSQAALMREAKKRSARGITL